MAVDASKPLDLISFGRIVTEPIPPIIWDVEPLIAQGSRVVLYGEFGAMKSWLLPHLALHLAAGVPWLGKFEVPQARRVLYVDEEMGERRVRRRVKRLAMGAGLEGSLPFQAVCRLGLKFNTDGATKLISALRKSDFDPDVLIFETFRRVLVGGENGQEEVTAFWCNVEPLVEAGKTLIFSHHMRKPNRMGPDRNRDRASGSTDILAGADVSIALERLQPDVIRIEMPKDRDAAECEDFAVQFEADDPDGPVRLTFGGLVLARTAASKLAQACSVCEAFLAGSPDSSASTAAILAHAETQGVAARTAEEALRQGKEGGRLGQPVRGQWTLKRPEAPPGPIPQTASL